MLWVKHGSRGHKVATTTTTTTTTGCFTGFLHISPAFHRFHFAIWGRLKPSCRRRKCLWYLRHHCRAPHVPAWGRISWHWLLESLGKKGKLGFRTNTHTCSETSLRTLCFETTPVLTFKSRAWSIVCARLVFQIWHIRNQQLGLSSARTKEQLQPETQQRRGACWQTLRGIGLQRNLPGVSMRCMRSVWFIYI